MSWLALLTACTLFGGEPPRATTEADAADADASKEEAPSEDADATPPEGADPRKGGGSGPVVDIFLAGGTPAGDQSCHFAKREASAERCSIHRVRWDLGANRMLGQEQVTGANAQGWMPTVSPDGTHLAYAHKAGRGAEVMIKDLTSKSAPVAASHPSMTRPPMWTFPHWLDDGHLLVSHPDMAVQCVSPRDGQCKRIERWNDTWSLDVRNDRVTGAKPLLGIGPTSRFAVEDTWVNPRDRTLVAAHGRQARTGDPDTCSAGKGVGCRDVVMTPYPYVFDVDDGTWWAYQLRTTEPQFARNGPLPLLGCAHLSWSPSGKRLMCTEQSTQEIHNAGLSSRLFAWDFDRERDKAGSLNVRDVTPMFNHKAANELIDLADGETCDVYYHKYAEFCGTDHHVVASIACDCASAKCQRDGGGSGRVISAHVYLIDVEDPNNPQYTDITAAMERDAGLAAGGMRAFTATCSTATVARDAAGPG